MLPFLVSTPWVKLDQMNAFVASNSKFCFLKFVNLDGMESVFRFKNMADLTQYYLQCLKNHVTSSGAAPYVQSHILGNYGL